MFRGCSVLKNVVRAMEIFSAELNGVDIMLCLQYAFDWCITQREPRNTTCTRKEEKQNIRCPIGDSSRPHILKMLIQQLTFHSQMDL